ncbi:MAG: SgcJ/EcaC family oxidoreductase, partial [Pseudomonadota bacterium]|nr:SgcJ/EcaC family oxidoreductase [Pseudomonadota bacterium]
MKLKIAALTVLLLTHAPAVAQSAADKTAVTSAIDRWDRAWQVKDHKLATSDYAEETHWVNAFGQRAMSRAEVERTLREVFTLPFVVAGNSRTVGHDVRFLGKDVAVVTTQVERHGQKTPDSRELGSRQTSHLRVFQRQNGTWRIT